MNTDKSLEHEEIPDVDVLASTQLSEVDLVEEKHSIPADFDDSDDQKPDVSGTESRDEKESDITDESDTTEEEEEQGEGKELEQKESNDSITASMFEITKSQILTSENEIKAEEECHNSAEFITSTNNELIESTYSGDDSEEQEKAERPDQELFEDVKMTSDLQRKITELSGSLITSVDLQAHTNKERSGLAESCVDLGGAEAESAKEMTVENAMEANEAAREMEANSNDLTESCVDLGGDAEVKNELVEDYQPNASMEIIEKKVYENDEDYEKVEADASAPVQSTTVKQQMLKRNIEEEIYEKPLGGDSLQKKILEYGEEVMGRDCRPSRSQMVTISYSACLKGSTNVVEQNDELSFILGDGDVISAIDLVVSLMSRNEKCEVITEARHAYGSLGKKPDIPCDAILCYHIHLKDFKDVTDFNLMAPVERLSLSEAKKLRGNFHFNRQDFNLAANSYKKGLKYFDLENLTDDEDQADLAKYVELKKALLMNLALSDFKQNEYKKALDPLNQVLDIESTHMKALFIRGKVLMHLGETADAILSLTRAHELAKDNIEVKNELMKAQAKHKIQYEKEKRMYQKMMRGTSEEVDDKKKGGKDEAAKSAGTSPFVTYTVAGMLMAGATLGVAMLAKYKNLL